MGSIRPCPGLCRPYSFYRRVGTRWGLLKRLRGSWGRKFQKYHASCRPWELSLSKTSTRVPNSIARVMDGRSPWILKMPARPFPSHPSSNDVTGEWIYRRRPSEPGYYLGAWQIDARRWIVSELWFNPDSTGTGWWATRSYLNQERTYTTIDVRAWMPMPEFRPDERTILWPGPIPHFLIPAMTGRPYGWLSPHGTAARARWHYRQGHKPLRDYCPACANANAARKRFAGKKRKERGDKTKQAEKT
jgi:hypothetical protein